IVMSDLEDFTVTYTAVSSPFRGLSEIRSLGVDGPPVMPEDLYAYIVAAFQAPPSPDYVHGPEEPKQAPPLPEFVPELVYQEFMPPEDDEDPEEDDDEDPEEDPSDYPTDRDDDDDEEEDEDDEEEEEEHLAPLDSITVSFPAVDHVPSAEETKPFETDEFAPTPPTHPAYRVTARISIRAQTPVSLPSDIEVAGLLVIPTLPPSLLSPWSSPLPPDTFSTTTPDTITTTNEFKTILSPSTSHLLPLPPPIVLPHTRAYVTMMRAAAPSTYILAPRSGILPSETPPSWTPPLLPLPLPTLSPPLLLPSTDCRVGVFEATLMPQNSLRRDDEIRRYPEKYVGYGIADTWEDMVDDVQGIPVVTDVAELSQRMTDFVMTIRQDTDEIYRERPDGTDN
ncbi:hypothetical protein Tco_0459274, partial [Tanacetum coccineum]